MNFFLRLILILSLSITIFAGSPAIDGSFDGIGTWGSAAASADGTSGWNSVNIYQLFVTYDDSYAYFAVQFIAGGYPAAWMRVGFVVNTKSGGGNSDPWGGAVSYGHSSLPDYVLLGRLGTDSNWAEIRSWNGTDWDGNGINIYSSDMNWAADLSYVEGRISLATLGNPSSADVQVYVSGNNPNEHGTFDACPDDEVSIAWNDPTTLDNYIPDQSLPVELSAYKAHSSSIGVELTWTTDSEIENQGFIISRKSQAENWTEIASFATQKALEGQGSTTRSTDYSFVDTRVREGVSYSYQLSDVDYSGKRCDHSDRIETITYVNPGENIRPQTLDLVRLYPNPFNPTVTLSYDLAEMTDVNVSIYSMTGELVWNHVQANHPAGQNYTLDWNGSDLSGAVAPSGIYLISIRAGEQNLTRKVTLLR